MISAGERVRVNMALQRITAVSGQCLWAFDAVTDGIPSTQVVSVIIIYQLVPVIREQMYY